MRVKTSANTNSKGRNSLGLHAVSIAVEINCIPNSSFDGRNSCSSSELGGSCILIKSAVVEVEGLRKQTKLKSDG